MSIIDYRSDTLTKPSPSMRAAMAAAEVGDDVYDEDPTVNALQHRVASIFGFEDGLFMPTGTMSNLIACMVHCNRRQSEAIMGSESHIYLCEGGGCSAFGGIHTRGLPTDAAGCFNLADIEYALRSTNVHHPVTSLVAVENTHNFSGGSVVPMQHLQDLRSLTTEHSLPLHCDGARIWNAAVATGDDPAVYSSVFDSMSVCFSKALGCPVGSMLLGSRKCINAAKFLRKGLGGGMRQIGVLGACVSVALDNWVDSTLADHRHARELASALDAMPGVQVCHDVSTNIILFDIADHLKAPTKAEQIAGRNAFVKALRDRGVGVGPLPFGSSTRLRAVTHCNIGDDDIRRTIDAFLQCVSTS